MAALTIPFLGFLGTVDEPMGWGARARDVKPWLPAGGRLEVLALFDARLAPFAPVGAVGAT